MRLLRSLFSLFEFVRVYLSTEVLGNAIDELGELSNPYLAVSGATAFYSE
jgi:hypothetical protein